ncbi:RagB/SusD family nutrient uptake outer membrane protein [Bacteroides faecium]|uniref:RagB/SusD family nutrient uptake outer membrane protein n=1 Tax=Bacteroides faecium TaxID=2715212 RepID=A0A6H0KU61_9BACE|nr:RagB/SusD family nutrient uptake outer membrane protein [Bacteroides faecium]QIU96693.1 RagB/SusD family nutrient uptake outer membrane protein [Bacteroides faecium]
MKKIKYIALGVLATLLSGCGNDWLDLQSSTAIETEGSLTELRDFEFVLNGAYSSMQSSNYYGADMVCYGDLTGDDMKSYKSSSTNVSYYTFKYNKTNGPSGFWGMYYGVAKNLNILLRDIEKIELVPDREIMTPKQEKLTEQVYHDDLKGEALAIRALLLFDVTRLYGYPYLKDNGASLAAPIIDKVVEDKNFKPSRNTTAQCYKAITDDLIEAVKLLRPVKKEGKINKWAAMTLLSRVYLYMGNNGEAYNVATEAIKGAEKQGYKLWTNDEYAKIWATPFNSELLFEIVNLTTDSPGKSSIGYLCTKYNLIATEKYWKKYMKEKSDDVRSQMVSTASSSKPFCLKYPAQGDKSYEDANIPIFRLSELYLNAAEAAVKKDDITNTRKYLKPIYARTGENLDDLSDDAITLDLVLEQRRIEFWGEGQRFFDLIRNNKKVERTDYLSEVPEEARSFDWNYYKIVLPVPNHEMEYNENMVQNPEYELH